MIAFDLFAGVGWALACRTLGITDRGVDNATTVVETRKRAGFETVYNDVWDGLFGVYGVGRYDILIASPPCQTFSAAGKGAGRKALDQVLAAIRAGLHRDPVALHELTVSLDPRTALVLTPLAHVYRDRPQYVVLEQVAPVLPVWEAYAAVMRELGYSVVTGILSAEQYGVPQTRRRAILIARRDGIPAAMPEPTHSRYYSQDPNRMDLGLQKWVAIAEALEWQADDPREAHAMRGRGQIERYGERPGRRSSEPAFTLRANGGGNASCGFVWRTADGAPWTRVSVAEAAVLQSFPARFGWAGTKTDAFQIIGNAVPPLLGQHVLAAATAGALDVPEAVAA